MAVLNIYYPYLSWGVKHLSICVFLSFSKFKPSLGITKHFMISTHFTRQGSSQSQVKLVKAQAHGWSFKCRLMSGCDFLSIQTHSWRTSKDETQKTIPLVGNCKLKTELQWLLNKEGELRWNTNDDGCDGKEFCVGRTSAGSTTNLSCYLNFVVLVQWQWRYSELIYLPFPKPCWQ